MPLIEYPELGKQWMQGQRSNPGLLPSLLKRADRGGVQNCPLPRKVTGFVQGAPYHTLLNALRTGILQADNVDHDHGLAGASYVYFRIMMSSEHWVQWRLTASVPPIPCTWSSAAAS